MTTLLVATWVLTYLCAVHSKPSFIENDSIVFPEVETDTAPSEFTDKLKECIRDNFKIEFNGECRALLATEGACPEDHWLVLDLLSASLPKPIIQGKCALRRCSPKQHYWVEQNRCVYPNESSALCPKGNIITTDVFGEGFCECIRDPIHARDRNGVCYPAFTRGPCLSDRVWVQVNGRAECRIDNCTVTRNRFPGKTILSWGDGKCYAVNERGPCAQGNVIRINMWSKRPECGDPLTPLHLVDPPCTGLDHSGKCTRPVNTPQNLFYSQVAEQASKKRTRKGFNNPK